MLVTVSKTYYKNDHENKAAITNEQVRNRLAMHFST